MSERAPFLFLDLETEKGERCEGFGVYDFALLDELFDFCEGVFFYDDNFVFIFGEDGVV